MIPRTSPSTSATQQPHLLHDRRVDPGLRNLDPIDVEPRILPRAGLEWLNDNGYINPSDESPFAFLRQEASRTSRAQRTRAAASLFASGDLLCRRRTRGGRGVVTAGGVLERSLAILERPQARLRFGISESGQLPTMREFYLCGNHLVSSFSDGETAFVGEPARLEDVLACLVRHLASPDLPAQMEMICMMPQLYELVTVLWKQQGKPLAESLSRAEVARLLPDGDRRAAGELLASMTEAGVLRPGDRGHTLSPAYQHWLGLAWSDSVFEIERGEPDGDGWGRREQDRLLFVGPPGQRVLCEDVALDGGKAEGSASGDQPGRGVMLLSRLGGGDLIRRLATLLRPVERAAGIGRRGRFGRAARQPRFDVN